MIPSVREPARTVGNGGNVFHMIAGIGRISRGALVTLALMCIAPAVASAAQSLAVTSASGFPAGGHPTYTTTINLDTSAGAPSGMTISLAPGVLASVAANPSCVKGAPQYTTACQIGTGSAGIVPPLLPLSLDLVPLKAYLVPPPSSGDLVGIDLKSDVPGIPVTHAGGQLVQTASGNVQTILHVDLSQLGLSGNLIGKMTLTINGTLQGKPFNRMPTNCSPAATTLSVTYASKTEPSVASPDFKPTGCASLPFSPTVSGTAVEDANDPGAAVSTTVTQAADEAASSSTQLVLPWPTLAPNFNALSLQNTSTPVGSATVVTPLLPVPLQGKAYLTGAPTGPTMTLRFPPPAAMMLVGTIDLANHAVKFPTIPDVPVTQLTVSLLGGPKSLLTGACQSPSGTLDGVFTAQNGKSAKASKPVSLAGCSTSVTTGSGGGTGTGSGATGSGGGKSGAGKPGSRGSRFRVSHFRVSGLAKGKPVISFTLGRGTNAPKIRSFTITLPSGLTFVRRHLGAGIHLRPAHTLRLHSGRLTITLGHAVNSVSVRMTVPALRESTQLKRHPKRRLTFRFS